MKGIAAFGFALCLTGAAPAAFQGNMNFRNVAITNAAQYRADWRSCKVDGQMDWTKAEALGEGVVYLPLKLTVADGWARQMYCHAVRIDTSKPNLRFTGNERCAGWGEPNTEDNPANKTVLKNTVREKTADFIARFRGSKADGGKARLLVIREIVQQEVVIRLMPACTVQQSKIQLTEFTCAVIGYCAVNQASDHTGNLRILRHHGTAAVILQILNFLNGCTEDIIIIFIFSHAFMIEINQMLKLVC